MIGTKLKLAAERDASEHLEAEADIVAYLMPCLKIVTLP